jgi:hypothetical protein
LNNVGNGLLSYTTSLVDVLEGIEFLGALMLDDPHLIKITLEGDKIQSNRGAHLAKRTLADRAVKVEVIESDFAVEIDRLR